MKACIVKALEHLKRLDYNETAMSEYNFSWVKEIEKLLKRALKKEG